ncbi:MAG: Crp/Fnr family transcriptional regulator [Bdellovibrionia bacterium]
MADGKKVPKDHYIFRDGDQPDAMYIVKSGAFAVTKTKGNSEIILAEVGPGAMVGEMALFDMKPRSANVKAIKDSEVIALPYEALKKQMEQLPVWVRAIMKNMNENLREMNKKLKILENPAKEEERFPPHIVNKYISILNLVGHRYGRREEDGSLSFSSHLLRNYTIQIFQEATNKMDAMVSVLAELEYLVLEDRGDGTKKIINKFPEELFTFVDWYNEWLFKQDKDRMPLLSDQEVKILNGLLVFAKKVEPDKKGFSKISLNDVQNDSMKEVGFLIKLEDPNSLIEKGYLTEKIMDEKGVYIAISLDEVEIYARNWTIVNTLKKKLR